MNIGQKILITLCLGLIFYPFFVRAEVPAVVSVRVGVAAGGPNVSPLSVAPNAITTYHVNGTVSDADGFADILSVGVVFYRSGVANGADCNFDKNNCYRPPDCNLSNGNGNTVDYDCQIDVDYFADPTDSGTYAADSWKVRVRVTDSLQSVDDTTYNNEINSLLAVSINPPNINYGSLALGNISNSVAVNIKNSGNVGADTQISASGNMGCPTGNIPVANQKYGRTDGTFQELEYTLSTTPTGAVLNLPQQTNDGVVVNDDLFFKVKIPTSGVRGVCNGITNITAISI